LAGGGDRTLEQGFSACLVTASEFMSSINGPLRVTFADWRMIYTRARRLSA
jgi:hypothetical protein